MAAVTQRDIINIAQSPVPTEQDTYVKINALNRLLCYQRGGHEDRAIRRKFDPIMIEFPNGNEYSCVTYYQALEIIHDAKAQRNVYADEARAIFKRMYAEYWTQPTQSI